MWSVHRGEEFREYMKTKYPNVILIYIPGGCTGVVQPCDVFLQRPLKHAITEQFSKWGAEQIKRKLDEGVAPAEVRLDLSVGTIRDAGLIWIVNAWRQVKEQTVMMVRGWNKCGFRDVFEPQFQLESTNKWHDRGDIAEAEYIPYGVGRIEKEEVEELEEEEDHSPEQVMEACLSIDNALTSYMEAVDAAGGLNFQ